MNVLWRLGILILTLTSPAHLLWCQGTQKPAMNSIQQSSPDVTSVRSRNAIGYQVLSKEYLGDSSIDLDPILTRIRNNWYSRILQLSSTRKGLTVLEFSVERDGTVGPIKTAHSAGAKMLDQAAEDSIQSSSPFAAFPAGSHLQSVRLRFHFLYQNHTYMPCSGGFDPGVYKLGGDVKSPIATYAPDPEYSDEARHLKYQGINKLEVIVGTDGLPSRICVEEALGHGLDQKAVEIASKWKFQPATKNGTPVPVLIHLTVGFRTY